MKLLNPSMYLGAIVIAIFASTTARAQTTTTTDPNVRQGHVSIWVMERPSYECVDGHITRTKQRAYSPSGDAEETINIIDTDDGCVNILSGRGTTLPPANASRKTNN